MGLGIEVFAPLPRDGAKPMKWPAFAALVAETLDGEFIELHEDDAAFGLEVHPGSEFLRFEAQPDNCFSAAIKTSTLGPGFHAEMVRLLKLVAAAGNLDIDWAEADETGYAADDDFGALQEQMAEQFVAIVRIMSEHSTDEALCVNWPLGVPTPRGNSGGLFTPSGPLTPQWCQEVIAGNDIERKCREFFVWWNKDRDAGYWQNLAHLILWSEVRWRPPMSEDEERTWSMVLLCEDELKKLGAASTLPAAEIAELKELLEWPDDTPCREPAKKGIGYYRHDARWQLPGGWSLTLGGYFFHDVEDDGDTLLYFFNERTVRFSSANINSDDGPVPAEELLETATDNAPSDAEFIEFKNGEVLSRGFICEMEEDGETFTGLSATLAIPGGAAWLTVCFNEPRHREWAMSVLRSISHPGQAESGSED
jgi:hypothetical protein